MAHWYRVALTLLCEIGIALALLCEICIALALLRGIIDLEYHTTAGLRRALDAFKFSGCSVLHADGCGTVFMGSYQGLIAQYHVARREISPVVYVRRMAKAVYG